MKKKNVLKPHGFLAVSTVLILSAVTLMIASTVAIVGIGEAQSSFAIFKGEQNLSLVEGCAEDYLLKIRSNSAYSGGTITRPEGTCTITINTGNPNWDITVSSTDTTYQRKIQVTFMRSMSGITITRWREI